MIPYAILQDLLNHLPDSIHEDDESWGYAWNELSDEAQASVKAVRERAMEFATYEMHPVVSSNIAAWGYHPGRGILRVRFTSDAIYEYEGVPETCWQNLLDDSLPLSAGERFHQFVKKGDKQGRKYEYRKVEDG